MNPRNLMRWCGLLLLMNAAAATAADWPQHRGPTLDGTVAEGVLDAPFRLEMAWRLPLGSGYSAVSIAGDRAVTMFSEGGSDFVVALDTATGNELWRAPLGPTYLGHDGSSDGPVGTPTLDDERVYVLGPYGQLQALDISFGWLLWSKDLPRDFGSKPPFYGFSTSPLIVGNLLVVQTGGENHRAVTAFDKTTGEVRWSADEDLIHHQSPVLMEIGGTTQILSVGATHLTALRLSDGQILWRHAHSEQPGYDPTFPQAIPIGEDRLLLTFEKEARLYRLHQISDPNTMEVREVWRSSAFKDTTALPVAYGEHLYGFSGRFLSCVDIATGEMVWKSRPPGGRGLILVDNHLLIFGSLGWLTAVEATPVGYHETAKIQVSEQGSYTAPSFAGGRIFVRNLERVAAVQISAPLEEAPLEEAPSPAPTTRAASETPRTTRSDFETILHQIRQDSAKGPAMDRLLATYESFPVIECGAIDGGALSCGIHFLYRGDAEAVSISGQMLEDAAVPEELERIPGTNLFHRRYRAAPDVRWQYRLQVDFEDPGPDPRNPQRTTGAQGFSEVTMPGFQDPEHTVPFEDPGKVGRLEKLSFESKVYGQPITTEVYLPAGYEPDGQPYPLLLMLNGGQWLELGLKNSLDHLLGSRAQPAIVVFVPIQSWVGGSYGGRARRLIKEELLPRLETSYRLSRETGDTALWVVQDKTCVALDLVYENPERFASIAIQSPSMYRVQLPKLDEHRGKDLRFYVGWSRYESKSAEKGFDERQQALDLRAWLEGLGFRVAGAELTAGPGFRTWRLQAEEILSFLLPLNGRVSSPNDG